MHRAKFNHAALPTEIRSEINRRWERALRYFRQRGSVLFLSYCRYWEQHGQPHRSLAKALAEVGIPVHWYDGAGWRPYRPYQYWELPSLSVSQLPQLPGLRVPLIERLNTRLQQFTVDAKLKQLGGKPILWVQGGIDERLAERLPYVDVFSFFDDCYRNATDGPLCSRASLILTQNSFAQNLFAHDKGHRVRVGFPPMDMSQDAIGEGRELTLPVGFPTQRMGYVGSYFPSYFDFDLFENFIQTFPNWGFLLMGRTDADGEAAVRRLAKYPNFHCFPWVPRDQVGAAWKLLNVCLLLYRPLRTQEGAFPSKLLEALAYSVPSVATRLPKTADLEGYFPTSPFADVLKSQAVEVAKMKPERLAEIYLHFACEMDPKLHLARVAEFLGDETPSTSFQ